MAKGGGFPGMGGANMQQLMRQAQKMQADMQRSQEELQAKEFTADAGGGMVSATVSGSRELKSLTINPACVDPDDVEMLQDLLVAAFNEALRKVSSEKQSAMGGLTGGFGF